MLNSKLPDVNVPLEALSRMNGSREAKSPEVAARVASILDAKRGTPEFVDLCEMLNVKDRDADLLALAAAHSSDSTGAAAIRLVVKNGNHAEMTRRSPAPTPPRSPPPSAALPTGRPPRCSKGSSPTRSSRSPCAKAR